MEYDHHYFGTSKPLFVLFVFISKMHMRGGIKERKQKPKLKLKTWITTPFLPLTCTHTACPHLTNPTCHAQG